MILDRYLIAKLFIMTDFIGVPIEIATIIANKMSDEELCKEYNLLPIRKGIFVLKGL